MNQNQLPKHTMLFFAGLSHALSLPSVTGLEGTSVFLPSYDTDDSGVKKIISFIAQEFPGDHVNEEKLDTALSVYKSMFIPDDSLEGYPRLDRVILRPEYFKLKHGPSMYHQYTHGYSKIVKRMIALSGTENALDIVFVTTDPNSARLYSLQAQ